MLDICYEEFEYIKERIKEGLEEEEFLETWDFEDEYSHNHIEENQHELVKIANEYFIENNLPYTAKIGCLNVIVSKNK